jgi:nicotinamidase-related amidase
MRRVLTLPTPATTHLLVCDVQERFRPLIWRFPAVLSGARTLCRVAALLGLPATATEQNPARLGATVGEVAGALGGDAAVLPKMTFSMLTPAVRARVGGTQHAILCGIEAHVCVQQTALALLQEGVQVHLVVDALSSQRAGDRAVALANLVAAGAAVTTTEAIVFQLLADAAHPRFKEVQRVVMEHNEAVRALGGDGLDVLA